MNKKLYVLVALALPLYVAAQPSMVLIEACNAIADPGKRMECLKAAVGAAAAPETDKRNAAVEALKRAFGNMHAGLNVGMSYNNYQIAVLDLAKAVTAFRQDAGELATPVMGQLNESIESYRDAGVFWERSIGFYAQRNNSLSYAGGLPIGLNNMEWLVRKYNLPTVKSDLLGFHSGLHVPNTRAAIWSYAGGRYHAAINLLVPPAPAEPATPLDLSTKTAAEDAAKASGCTSEPVLAATVNMPAMKEFAVRCTSGKVILIKCESGVCKAPD